jgi:hypothetical protein
MVNLVTRTRWPHGKQRRQFSDNGPQPGFTAVLTPACFVDVQSSGISNIRYDVVISRLESLASDALQAADLSVGHFQVKQIPQNSGNHSLAEPAKTTQQSGDGHDTGPKAPAWHCGRQLSPTSLSAVRTPERVNLMFCDNRLNWGGP